nr:type II toxin-antitoxin system HicB family antitoxin [uncultured Cohaesibacter sp.]
MIHYIAVIEKDPDSAYGVSFPQLEGVFSAGDSFDEATRNASEALQLFFEDNPAERPAPWSMEQVRALEDVQADLATGATLVAIPYIELTGRTVRANLTFDAGLLTAIDEEAKARGISRSAFVASASQAMLNA